MTRKDFYVYVHYRATDSTPFYVGKGSDRRMMSHENRNKYWKNTVSKHGFFARKVVENLLSEDAYTEEIRVISLMRDAGEKLCNMTDGGDGTRGLKSSPETLKKLSLAHGGKKNANYNENVHTFVNDKMGVEFFGTQFDMFLSHGEERSGISMLCSGKIWRFKGWRLSTTDKDFFPNSGRESHTYNDNMHIFKNKISKEEFVGSQMEFRNLTGINHSYVSAICRGRRKSTSGWQCLNSCSPKNPSSEEKNKKTAESMSGKSNPQYDPRLRVFKHKDGRLEVCTIYDMRKTHGATSHISTLIAGRIAHHKGWAYLGLSRTNI